MTKPRALAQRVSLAFGLSIALATPVFGNRFHVEFSGTLTSAGRIGGSTPFADFRRGQAFHGSFDYDASLIDRVRPYTIFLTSGEMIWYSSPIRNYQVTIELPSGPYTYAAPFFADAPGFEGQPLSTWRIGDDVNGRNDEVGLRVLNYPTAWSGGRGEPFAGVPPEQIVEGLYPHSSFFSLADSSLQQMIAGDLSPTVDLEAAFSAANQRTWSLRFTSATHPDWGRGREALIAAMHGSIESLVVTIPEPGSALLVTASIVMAGAARRRQRLA